MKIHFFSDTGEAYDACQCDENVKNGDTLICGNVVALAYTWPVSVTAAYGHLHTMADGKDPATLMDLGDSSKPVFTYDQILQAVRLAVWRKLPLHPAFAPYAAHVGEDETDEDDLGWGVDRHNDKQGGS